VWLPNGVDVSFYDPQKTEDSNFRNTNGFKADDIIFFYGGILGYAQGLEIIIEAAKQVKENTTAQFVIQGSGPEKDKLVALNQEYKLNNVHFLEPVPKAQMPGILKAVDVALVPLKRLDLFKGAIPSKIFEALAMKKPLILGVDGEARTHFIDNAKSGLYYTPEDILSLKQQVLYFLNEPEERKKMGENAREYVAANFDRNKIAQGLYHELQNM
jgi:glycosyltransferase involved in cell wall biosynthesis